MRRKLPSPDKLYDLLINKGKSYSELATDYGMIHTNVFKTFRRDCEARGIDWPVERKVSSFEAQSRGINDSYLINSAGVAEVVREFMDDWQMTCEAFARYSGVAQRTVNDLLNNTYGKLRKPTAIKLLKACEEEIAESLESWQPRKVTNLRSSKHDKPAKSPRHRHDDVLDDWEFLRSCGWTSAERIAAKIGMSTEALQRTLLRYRDDPRVGNLKWVFIDDNSIPLV